MPSDSVHTIFNFIIFALISILNVQYPLLSLIQYAVFTLFFILGTLILNPDLDTNSKSSQRCGVACKPYKWLFKHRGTSHHWLWGTVARIGYVLVICLVVLLVLGVAIQAQELNAMWQIIIKYWIEVLAGIAGLFIANVLHIFLDKIT